MTFDGDECDTVSTKIRVMQIPKEPGSVPFKLVAGHPALDLVNTLDWRFRPSGSEELLNNYADLLRFTEQSGLMKSSEIQKLATSDPVRKRRSLSSTKRLRECLASILYPIADGQVPPIDSVRTLSAFARTMRKSEDLEWRDFRLQWKAGGDRVCASDVPLRRLVSTALELLTSGEIDQLRACSNQECRWLFLDGSKNKARRWCDMKLCGNRIKARRYRGKQRVVDSQ
jgi:predicted RNA-binding Zn ribbon-like protein